MRQNFNFFTKWHPLIIPPPETAVGFDQINEIIRSRAQDALHAPEDYRVAGNVWNPEQHRQRVENPFARISDRSARTQERRPKRLEIHQAVAPGICLRAFGQTTHAVIADVAKGIFEPAILQPKPEVQRKRRDRMLLPLEHGVRGGRPLGMELELYSLEMV